MQSNSEIKLPENQIKTGRSLDNFLETTMDGSTGAGKNSSSVFNIHALHV